MNLEELEDHIHYFLDIEIYSAEEILKSEGCGEHDKKMSMAYQMAINRAKKLVSICCREMEGS